MSARKPRENRLIENSLRILIVDDEPTNRKYVSMLLSRSGHPFDAVKNGLEAVSVAKVRHYDLIVMDCGMPVMDGFEATQRIRKLDLDRRPFIIGLTGFASKDVEERCYAAGMDQFLSKPIAPDRLLAEIDAGLASAV